MKKVKLTKELIERAAIVFKVKKQIKTNDGLTRAELRKLEREGLVGSKMFKGSKIWFLDRSGIDSLAHNVHQ